MWPIADVMLRDVLKYIDAKIAWAKSRVLNLNGFCCEIG